LVKIIHRMKNTDPRVDAYIEKAATFAKPILKHIRKLAHKACPELSETIKWGHPHFEYHGVICGMASFMSHSAFFFRRPDLIKGLKENSKTGDEKAMGQFGHLKSLKDLPADSKLLEWMREAAKLNAADVPEKIKKKIVKKKILKAPDYFSKSINTNKKAAEKFKLFTDAQRNEYIEWVSEAKTETTRNSRMKTMLEWVKEGKPRNWKYMEKYK